MILMVLEILFQALILHFLILLGLDCAEAISEALREDHRIFLFIFEALRGILIRHLAIPRMAGPPAAE